jgi:hypothetical protein
MRVKILLVLAAVVALGLAAPAHADFTGVCNTDPFFCVGVDQLEDEGTSGTFVVADTEVAGAFGGTESNPDDAYTAAGACAGSIPGFACGVVVRYGDELYLYTEGPAGCMMTPLNGGTRDWCSE